MRALIGDGVGGLELDDVPEPEAEASEAIVKVSAVSLNRGELRLLEDRPHGWRPGQDVSGTVVAPAADGSGPTEGSRVVAWPGLAGWAERVAVPTTHLATIQPNVDFPQAATLPVAGSTALRALRLGGDLKGKAVLVTGASGGVGRFAVELAASSGAAVSAVVRGPERSEGLNEVGARSILVDIADATGPFDIVLESVGGPSLTSAVRLLAPGAVVIVFGNSSKLHSEISFADFVGKPGARLEPFFVYQSDEPPTFGDDLKYLADLVAGGDLHPYIGLEIPWTDANKAVDALRARRVNGKAVLRMVGHC